MLWLEQEVWIKKDFIPVWGISNCEYNNVCLESMFFWIGSFYFNLKQTKNKKQREGLPLLLIIMLNSFYVESGLATPFHSWIFFLSCLFLNIRYSRVYIWKMSCNCESSMDFTFLFKFCRKKWIWFMSTNAKSCE